MSFLKSVFRTHCLLFLVFTLSPFVLFPSSPLAATVAAVIDGDTIALDDGTKVRYLGVNTPERGQPFYEEAKRYNERLVLGKTVRVETGAQKRDGYGRILAYVYTGEVLVSERLIAEGWAYLFAVDPFDRYETWVQIQRRAQAHNKGMWRAGEASRSLRITTVRADAQGDDRRNPNGEYVRVCNVSTVPIDVQGFVIQEEGERRYTFPGGMIAPGYTAFLHSGRGRDITRGKTLSFYWGAGPVWNNDGDIATLFDPSGKQVDVFRVMGRERAGE